MNPEGKTLLCETMKTLIFTPSVHFKNKLTNKQYHQIK